MEPWELYNNYMEKGFTLVELVVVIAITAVLSGIILFSVTQYINIGKDSNVSGNLAVLIPAGEVFYNIENAENGDGYNGFCDPTQSSGTVFKNTISQMPDQLPTAPCYSSDITATSNPKGVCCRVSGSDQNYQAWAACANEFAKINTAYCVDSRGEKEEIDTTVHPCGSATIMTQCP